MPKTLSRSMQIFFIIPVLFVSACGQKGALYLGKAGEDKTDKPIFVPQKSDDIVPNYVQLQTLTVGGMLAQIKQTHLPSWQALLATTATETNLIRYVVFDGDVLGEKTPLTVLSGTVQNQSIHTDATRQITAGNYLRFRSLETGVNHLPSLLATAERYFKHNPRLVRDKKRPDFLTENQQNIDLYLAVEKR